MPITEYFIELIPTQEISIELRAISVQNFTSPATNLTIKIWQDDAKSFSTITKLLLAKNSELQIVDLDNLSTIRNVLFDYLTYVFFD